MATETKEASTVSTGGGHKKTIWYDRPVPKSAGPQPGQYLPPPCQPGDIVQWWQGTPTDGPMRMAIVIAVGARANELLVIAADMCNVRVTSVHHYTDKEYMDLDPKQRANGCWDYSREHKRLVELEATVEALQSELTKPKK